MVEEVLDALGLQPGGRYLDLTLGGGGHARSILLREPTCRVVGIDRDREVLERTRQTLHEFGDRVRTIHARFDLADQAEEWPGDAAFEGALLDLGMSSIQLDDPERGFSFQLDAELDFRMDRSGGETAADLLRRLPEHEIADLLFHAGDERRSRAIARAIVQRRKAAPLRRTGELVELIQRVHGGRKKAGRVHPATRTFQALRIAVNDEFGCLERVLPKAVRWLRPRGRLVVLSFHSGEDRRVKQFFREAAKQGVVSLPFRKPRRPTEGEVRSNPRSRSTRLRVAVVNEVGPTNTNQ